MYAFRLFSVLNVDPGSLSNFAHVFPLIKNFLVGFENLNFPRRNACQIEAALKCCAIDAVICEVMCYITGEKIPEGIESNYDYGSLSKYLR